MSWERASTHIIKMYGERGYPCLIPIVGRKYVVGLLFTSIEIEDVEMHDIIMSIVFLGKFSIERDCLMNDNSILSKAF